MIDVNALKTILKIQGVSLDLSDEELTFFLDYKIHELEGLIGFPIEETEKTDFFKKVKGETVLLSFYPVIEVLEVKVDGVAFTDYTVNGNTGVLIFKPGVVVDGPVEVSYTVGLPSTVIKSIVIPLITDMIIYTITNASDGDVSSIKEGDVSITYDNNTTLGNRINNRVNNLINRYSAKLHML